MSKELSNSEQGLVDQVMRFTKGFHRMKMTLTREVPDRAAYNLLWPLLEADKRATDLADIVHNDPSTVSRHISNLVSTELVRRVADQNDGRATLVSLTEKGRSLCMSLRSERESAMAKALQHWSEDDMQHLTRLMTRLNDDVEANFGEMLDNLRQAFDNAEFPDPQSPETSPSQKDLSMKDKS